MEESPGILWILVALLGTRRVFRLVIPKTALYPSMEIKTEKAEGVENELRKK